MSGFSKVIVGMFRRFGKVISFGKRKQEYTLPYKHLFDNKNGYYVPKKKVEGAPEGKDTPLPKSSAKKPHLYLVCDNKKKNSS